MHIVILVEFVEDRVDDTHRRDMYNHREVVLRFASIIHDDDLTMHFKHLSSNAVVVSASSFTGRWSDDAARVRRIINDIYSKRRLEY